MREHVAEVVFGRFITEVLHIQVASLFGVLVLKGFVSKLILTLGLLEGGLNVEELAFFDLFVVHSFDSSFSTFRSIFPISLVVGTIADKGKGTLNWGLDFLDKDGSDVTISFESFLDLRLIPRVRKVLNKDVVENFAEVTLRFGFEFNSDNIITSMSLRKSLGGAFGVLEANETIAARAVVFVQGDFGTDDFTVF